MLNKFLLDDENNFYVSTISLLEIAQLYRKKKFKHIDYELFDTGDKLIRAILNTIPIIKVLPFKEEHALIASTLTFFLLKNDMPLQRLVLFLYLIIMTLTTLLLLLIPLQKI